MSGGAVYVVPQQGMNEFIAFNICSTYLSTTSARGGHKNMRRIGGRYINSVVCSNLLNNSLVKRAVVFYHMRDYRVDYIQSV